MQIKILGPGCARCNQLESLTKEALKGLDLDVNIEKISDVEEILKYPIMGTPALIINKKIKVAGRVPNKEQIKKWISEERDE
ncbi:MAG: thioredoxin family protein [Armatimonadetes bacterium CG07_land_8_20_14_0_80_40_9]|nr:MAG: thioredoxin family protein [Armatimonadetes bacterium CG07_land_8_20_14_0_80_40_9]